MTMRRAVLAVLALTAFACAKPQKVAKPVAGDDYLYPAPAAGELRQSEAERFEKAWRAVLAGDSEKATRDFTEMLRKRPGVVPVQTGFAYARLRAGRHREAQDAFDVALKGRPEYVPALVGAGSAAYRQGDPEKALDYLRRAEAAAPTNSTVTRRLAELKLQITERRVSAAQAALAGGDTAAARDALVLALEAAPEVGALRVQYADLLLGEGDAAGAIEALRADPVGDRQVSMRLGELLLAQGDAAGALEAYRRVLQRDPKDAEAQEKALAARGSLELLSLPPEYRRIAESPRISRADLCALVIVKIPALKRLEGRDPDVAVDISGSWAREFILVALSHEILDVYPNHTFQPGATVRRGDLARAVARVLDLLKNPSAPAPSISDMSRNNLYYDSAARAVGAGVMDTTAAGAFEAWRPVSGRDASDVLEGLARLVGP
jgi:tetratricopeptide (TPR) repeat protein